MLCAIVIIATAIISATMAVILYAACVIAGGVEGDGRMRD